MFTAYRILIFSENPDKLMQFYRDILGLELEKKLDIPNDYGYMFQVNKDMKIWIGRHSEVHGSSKEPDRMIHNLFTDEVQSWYKKVRDAGMNIVKKPELTPFATKDNPVYVCTWDDPEGNRWQFMGKLK